jgi:hypothetical protein
MKPSHLAEQRRGSAQSLARATHYQPEGNWP